MSILDEIMDRLERGETLMIDDQERSYISMESGDGPNRFVMRSVLASLEDHGKYIEMTPKYDEQRFRTLVEALLSLTDWRWQSPLA